MFALYSRGFPLADTTNIHKNVCVRHMSGVSSVSSDWNVGRLILCWSVIANLHCFWLIKRFVLLLIKLVFCYLSSVFSCFFAASPKLVKNNNNKKFKLQISVEHLKINFPPTFFCEQKLVIETLWMFILTRVQKEMFDVESTHHVSTSLSLPLCLSLSHRHLYDKKVDKTKRWVHASCQ